jgi:hypothetical protein
MSLWNPVDGKERRALLKHLDSTKNRQAIMSRIADPAYDAEIVRLRDYHRQMYSGKTVQPIVAPQPGADKSVSPWTRMGLNLEVQRVAETHQVPFWKVCGHVNSGVPWPELQGPEVAALSIEMQKATQ